MAADMSMSVFLACLLNSASKVERNGLRDIGLLPELERSWLAGEARFLLHLVILCPAYATVRFVDNQTVRQDLAVELFR
jgi:hypothetical protein